VIPPDAVLFLTLIFAAPLFALVILVTWAFCALAKSRGLMPRDRASWIEKKWVVAPAAGLLAAYFLCFAYGSLIEANWVQETHTEIRVPRPVLGFDRFRIVHLSDLHLDRLGWREHRAAELIREAKPHLIVLTGDYLNHRESHAALHEFLSSLQAPYGVFGVEGNWDTKFYTRNVFASAGARYLEDESWLLEREGHRLRIVGQTVEPKRPLKEILSGHDDGAYTIYLSHKPDAVDELRNRTPGQGVDLFLCGHTHGGQVCLPFWGAVVTLSKYHKKYERGLYDFQGIPMYVNRGLGSGGGITPQVRFLSRPEVAVIDLVYR
jgi:predicted MPP superfamily phosphohydrolase